MPIEKNLTARYIEVMRLAYSKSYEEILSMTKKMIDDGCPEIASSIELVINEYLQNMSLYSNDDILNSIEEVINAS